MKKNILYITSSHSLYGGAELLLFELLRQIDRSAFNPVVVVPKWGELADRLATLDISTYELNLGIPESRKAMMSLGNIFRFTRDIFPVALRIKQIIRSENIDCVHTNTSVIFSGFLAAYLSNIPHVWHVREMLVPSMLMRMILGTIITMGSKKVICISNPVRAYLQPISYNLKKRITVIHDGIDINYFRSLSKTVPGTLINEILTPTGHAKVVCSIGRINPWKGQDILINASSIIHREISDIKFILIGGAISEYSGYEQQLKELASNLGVKDHIVFMGWQPRNVISAILQQVDLYVLPTSTSEGLGQVLLEASAWAKPLVATDVGGPRDIILDGENGYIVPPRNPLKMAEAILRVLLDPKKSNQMGQASFNRLVTNFGIDNYVNSIQQLYGETL
jgi:glycosyltransferase involved in cell wall biosynthesis